MPREYNLPFSYEREQEITSQNIYTTAVMTKISFDMNYTKITCHRLIYLKEICDFYTDCTGMRSIHDRNIRCL